MNVNLYSPWGLLANIQGGRVTNKRIIKQYKVQSNATKLQKRKRAVSCKGEEKKPATFRGIYNLDF